MHPSNLNCRATAYVQEDRMLIAVASWADDTVETSLDIRLPEGWDAGKVRYSMPYIENFQNERDFKPDSLLSISPAREIS